jgi:hypothetical protein
MIAEGDQRWRGRVGGFYRFGPDGGRIAGDVQLGVVRPAVEGRSPRSMN